MIHVFPINDIEEHDLGGTQCWCCPKIWESYGQIIVTHNAFDGRILKENEKKIQFLHKQKR
jgi:hypothetical protein